ncbi:MAG: DUF4177 domain-containing protein [Chloroflexota bacterium]|nr:DUF4177 domain-containing protein [Chloroflexota bacterium]
MDQWTYNILVADLVAPKPRAAKMWEVRGPDGLTDWDRLQNMGKEGWELVSVSPVAGAFGISSMPVTTQLVFTFKRKVQANPPQGPAMG